MSALNPLPLTAWGQEFGVASAAIPIPLTPPGPGIAVAGGVGLPLPGIESFRDALKKDLPAPQVLVEGLIHRGTKVSLAGGSKSYKTWTSMDLAASIAAGVPFLGLNTTMGRVLYVNLEIPEYFMLRRFQSLLEAKGIDVPENLATWNLRGHSCSAEKLVPQMVPLMREQSFALVVIDPVYKLMGGGDENSPADIGKVLNQFERIAVDTGAAVVFASHFSKGNQSSKQVLDRVSGSGVFARDPDSIITLTAHEENDAFVVEPVLRNFPPMKAFTVRWEHPLMHRADDLDPSELKQPNRARGMSRPTPTLEEFMAIFPTELKKTSLLTAADVSAAFVKNKWDKGSAVKLREAAIDAGLLRIVRGRHNRHSIGRPEVISVSDAALDQIAPIP